MNTRRARLEIPSLGLLTHRINLTASGLQEYYTLPEHVKCQVMALDYLSIFEELILKW